MRKTMVLFVVLLLASTAYAYDLNGCVDLNIQEADSNVMAKMGNCLIRGAFGADTILFSIIFFGIFALMMWQANMPMGATLGIGLVILFALGPMFGNFYSTLLNLLFLAIGAIIGLAIMHFVRR